MSASSLVLRRWQEEALPLALAALEERRNGVVVATTGAGKSIFLAALLLKWRETHPASEGVIVVTTPTRKLVEQLSDTLAGFFGMASVGRYYTRAKQHKRDIVVCCNPSVPALAEVLRASGRTIAVWFADEAHRTESDEIREVREEDGEGKPLAAPEILATLRADRRLGMTATPFRSRAEERLSLFDEVVYRYPPADARRDGVIVDWDPVPWDGDDRTPIDDACIQMIRAMGPDAGPGVVNASTIGDAVAYTDTLRSHGYRVEPIHSRMGRADQDAAIAKLKAGELDMLVHVAMLVEGVDFPWLRWLCMRRPVGARVRFIQEVGRVLRAAPETGKTKAVFLDPNGLFETFNITYEEALGWEEPTVKGEAEERSESEKDPKVRHARQLGEVGRYVRYLWTALVAEGIAPADTPMGGIGWRNDPVSDRQAAAIHRLMKLRKRLVDDHAEAIAKVCRAAEQLTKGVACDVMNLLLGLGKVQSGGQWAPASAVPIPEDEAFKLKLPVDDKVYVAGASSKEGFAAVVVMRGREVLYSGARVRQRGDTWATLTRSAIQLAADRHGAAEIVTSLDGMQEVPTRAGATILYVPQAENPAMRKVWSVLRQQQVPA